MEQARTQRVLRHQPKEPESHSEGFGTTASGDYSHSEGQNTTASGVSFSC